MQSISRKVGHKQFGSLFSVYTVPVLKDNFSYIIHDHKTNLFSFVDVAEVKPVIKCWEEISSSATASSSSSSANTNTLNGHPFCVFTTHRHWDHCGGNKDIAAKYGDSLLIYGGAKDKVPHCNRPVEDKDTFTIGALTVRVLFTPCHTAGHVLYHVSSTEDPTAGAALFTGDTLFVGGIGAFFEGNAKDMVTILDRVTAEFGGEGVRDNTHVFCGHEYTLNFLKFAKTLDPTNNFICDKISEFESRVAQGIPTIPSTIADELKMNPFMRTRDALIAKAVGLQGAKAADPVEVMQGVYNLCP